MLWSLACMVTNTRCGRVVMSGFNAVNSTIKLVCVCVCVCVCVSVMLFHHSLHALHALHSLHSLHSQHSLTHSLTLPLTHCHSLTHSLASLATSINPSPVSMSTRQVISCSSSARESSARSTRAQSLHHCTHTYTHTHTHAHAHR